MTGITQMLVAGQILDVGDNWIASLGGTGTTVAYDVSLDSSNNIYVIGYGNISNSNIELASYDINGTVRWQRSLGGTSTDVGYGVKVDSANNVCIVTRYLDPSGSINKIVTAKYDLSGVIQWQRVLSSAISQYAYGITTDTSNNIYIVGQYRETGYPSGFLIAKYNSSGAIQWQRSLRKTSTANGGTARRVAIDSSNNIYVFGSYDVNTSGPPLQDFVIAKYNSSGAIQWQYKLGLASTEDFGDITVTSSGDIYTTGATSSFSPQSIVIVKYDSLCNVQWQNRLYLTGEAAVGEGITVDYAGYVYVCGSVTSGAGRRGVIAKYDSSGVIQWQKYFRSTSASASVYFQSIKIDSFNNLIVSGYTNGSGTVDLLTVRLPSDGTKTGTYSLGGASYVYENASLTDASIFLTLSTSSLVDASTSLTDAAGTLTDASTSLTANLTVI